MLRKGGKGGKRGCTWHVHYLDNECNAISKTQTLKTTAKKNAVDETKKKSLEASYHSSQSSTQPR